MIAPGQTLSEVLHELEGSGLIPSVLVGRLYVTVCGRDRAPRFGHYRMAAGSRPVDALEQVLAGRVETVAVTVVEGSSALEIGDQLSAAGFGTPQAWQALIRRTDWIGDIAPGAESLEGFLFPDTYHFAAGTPAKHVAWHMVERYREIWRAQAAARDGLWGSQLEVVTLASLVEAETSLAEERPRIAGVFLNRLRRGMLLQCDPTVVFALKRRGEWQGRLLRVHWQLEDPYNTYRFPGLPPGPINSPGAAAIAAAVDPEPHSLLYFVARPGGGHNFSRTLREHNQAVVRLQRSRR